MEDATEEYQSSEVASIIAEALGDNPTMPITWLETDLFGDLYEKLSKYMNKSDLVYMLSELRGDFLQGFSNFKPETLHKICNRCRKCDNVNHPAVNPGWNVADPDLMIVLEEPSILRANQDFLVKALKEVGFKSDRCMVTYMVRCPVQSKEITDTNIANCIGYLHTEIQACNPKLVLVLGARPWGALTGDVYRKITEIEGNIMFFGAFPLLAGMSLAWYSYNHAKTPAQTNRLVEVLKTAKGFLYSSSERTDD